MMGLMVSKVNLSMMTMAKMNLKMKDKNDAFGRSAVGNDMMTLAGFNKLVQKESFGRSTVGRDWRSFLSSPTTSSPL